MSGARKTTRRATMKSAAGTRIRDRFSCMPLNALAGRCRSGKVDRARDPGARASCLCGRQASRLSIAIKEKKQARRPFAAQARRLCSEIRLFLYRGALENQMHRPLGVNTLV